MQELFLGHEEVLRKQETLSETTHVCPKCGLTLDRDVDAVKEVGSSCHDWKVRSNLLIP